MKGQLLGDLVTNHKTFRTDYSAEQITELRQAYDVAKKAFDVALSALYPFGEYDR